MTERKPFFSVRGAGRGLASLGCLLLAAAGCTRQSSYQTRSGSAGGPQRQEQFEQAIANLNRLEEYGTPKIVNDILERLNQWLRIQRPGTDWKVDPLISTLPKNLRSPAVVRSMGELVLQEGDQTYLQGCVWMRDAAKAAAAGESDDLEVARRLFDWTIRNIQLDAADATPRVPFEPWLAMITGHGVALERAHVFIQISRQQHLDAVMLSLASSKDGKKFQPWLPAVLIDGQLYLFDTTLGLPVPGPQGEGVATLSQAAADAAVLQALDIDDEHRYPVRHEQLKDVVALIDALPPALSQRMQLIEAKLAGDQRFVATVSPTPLAAKLKKNKLVSGVRLWDLAFASAFEAPWELMGQKLLPFQSQPALWKARLFHFKGDYIGTTHDPGEPSANRLYQRSRPAKAELQAAAPRLQPEQLASLTAARDMASYCLGLVAFERGEYGSAEDYFLKRTLEASPDGMWVHGARYNLGRTYEAQGRVEEAVAAYREQSDDAPQGYGNLLRAKWLEAKGRPAPGS